MSLLGTRIGGAVLQREAGGADYLKAFGTQIKGTYTSKDRFEEYLSSHGITEYVRQKRIVIGGQRRVVSFLFPGENLIVEIDGYAHQHSKRIMEQDEEKNRIAQKNGWRTLRIAVSDMHEPYYLEEIATLLAKK